MLKKDKIKSKILGKYDYLSEKEKYVIQEIFDNEKNIFDFLNFIKEKSRTEKEIAIFMVKKDPLSCSFLNFKKLFSEIFKINQKIRVYNENQILKELVINDSHIIKKRI